jgi:serine/threonine-protein kinase PRP4
MLHLMMDLKGKFNHRMIKKSKFGELHFDEGMNFRSVEKDKITGQVGEKLRAKVGGGKGVLTENPSAGSDTKPGRHQDGHHQQTIAGSQVAPPPSIIRSNEDEGRRAQADHRFRRSR